MTRPAPIIAGIVAVLLLLFGAYMGSYYALLNTYPLDRFLGEPAYRIDGVDWLFQPAHEVDRLIRPHYWR